MKLITKIITQTHMRIGTFSAIFTKNKFITHLVKSQLTANKKNQQKVTILGFQYKIIEELFTDFIRPS